MLLTNISRLAVVTDAECLRSEAFHHPHSIDDAWLSIEDSRIADFGPMNTLAPDMYARHTQVIDCEGGMVMPAWCDSHTHIVWAGSRWRETPL